MVLLLLLQGHSIGGAMAVLLTLMFRHRGVLHPEQIGPVYTFGSPAVFCDGALGGWGPCSQQQPGSEADSCTLVSAVLFWAVVNAPACGSGEWSHLLQLCVAEGSGRRRVVLLKAVVRSDYVEGSLVVQVLCIVV